MGCCGSSDNSDIEDLEDAFENTNNKATNKSIDTYMKNSHKQQRKIIKLLLLGAGSSGKSTLFRQIQSIHGVKYAYDDDGSNEYLCSMTQIKHDIRTNIFLSILKLLKQSTILSSDPFNDKECLINVNDPKVNQAITAISEAKKRVEREEVNIPLHQVGLLIDYVWKLEGIKKTYTQRQHFSIIENIDHFFDRVTSIMDDNDSYTPSRWDIIHSRIRTTGILKRKYLIQNVEFDLYDVGGQRSERKKWLSLFDNVDALIFVVALNGFCSVIFEDETVNKMTESLDLFEEQCNNKYFTSQKTQFILFLNKNDLFMERLKANMRLSLCFGDSFQGSNYYDKKESEFKDTKEREEWFKKCYNDAVDFVTREFLARNYNKQITSIFTHITTATDQNNIQIVFNDVRTGIIQRNLAKIGVAYNSGGVAGNLM